MTKLKDAAISAFRSPAIDYGDGIMPIARKDGFPVLLEELKHGSRNGRLFVVRALATTTWEGEETVPLLEEAVPFLIEILETEEDVAMRRAAITAMDSMDRKGLSAPALLKIVCGPKAGSLHIEATRVLMRVDKNGESIADALRSILLEENRAWLDYALKMLVNEMASASSRGAKSGAWADPVIEVIVEAMDHEREAIRHEALRAVARMGPEAKGMVDDLIQRFENAPTDELVLIIKALGEIGPAAEEAAPLLAEAAAGGEDKQVYSAAYKALRSVLGSPEEANRMRREALEEK